MKPVFVDRKDILTLKKTQDLIEELLETLDVLADNDTLQALSESTEDKKAGRVRPLKDFLADLNVHH